MLIIKKILNNPILFLMKQQAKLFVKNYWLKLRGRDLAIKVVGLI